MDLFEAIKGSLAPNYCLYEEPQRQLPIFPAAEKIRESHLNDED